MDYELRVIVEKVSVSTQEVVKRDTLKVYDIKAPESILELGLRHEEQISLLEKVQNSIVAAQSKLIDTGYERCPKCGENLHKRGFAQSKFHTVFTDHKVSIQKHHCCNPECDWQSTPTTTSVFGSSVHPDLAKLQCEQGASYSYRQAQTNLKKLNVHQRPVNNHNKIKLITNQVGALLAQENLKPSAVVEDTASALEATVQVDEGHLPTKDQDKRSFEALCAVVYRPENICTIEQHHREIEHKSCALSAKDDDLATIKIYTLNAALKQGMTKNTQVTALADGALNCWSVILSLAPHCKQILCILDWFDIAMGFENVRGGVEDEYKETLERVKRMLWHGKPDEALSKLKILITNVTDDKKRSKIEKLYEYLKSNQVYLVNYEERDRKSQIYTSQVAECQIESLINDRYKNAKKMQWTREGAHSVLQIRGMIMSNEWSDNWQEPILSALMNVA